MVEKKVTWSFRIEPSLKKRAEDLAKRKGVTLAALIRELILQAEKDEYDDPVKELRLRIEKLEKEVFGK